MVRSLFFAFLVLFAFFCQGFAGQSEEERLRDEYGLDSNNYYVDEGDEYVAGQGTEGELVESHGFDFVVESEEEEGEDAETLRLQFARANFIKSYYLFPSSKESRVFMLGEENELLVALTNNNEKNVNISVIRLSIMHPLEPTFYYIQNCTVQPYYQILGPKSTHTFQYRFVPDAMLQPRDYVVVVNVYFEVEDDKRLFIYQAVNFTHDFEDAPSKLDTEILFILFALIVFAGGIVYFIGSFFMGSKRTRGIDRTTSSSQPLEVQKEWIMHLEKPQTKKGKKLSNSS